MSILGGFRLTSAWSPLGLAGVGIAIGLALGGGPAPQLIEVGLVGLLFALLAVRPANR